MVRYVVAALVVAGAIAGPAAAEPTEAVVRVISQDAKFVGDTMGGAQVTLTDVATGAMLAQGVTTGSTGDTDAIMQATGRSPIRASDGSAAFRATIDINQPTLVRIDIHGPLRFPATMQRASSERWLIPGQAASGDGWVVELPGLAIQIDDRVAVELRHDVTANLSVQVQLMCGCPITPGGLWDAADYEVVADVRQVGQPPQRLALAFSEAPGHFATGWTPAAPGTAELTIIARNRITGNTGVLLRQLVVR